MPFAGYLSMFFTVVLLVTTAYFLLGGLPLLVLEHDTPLDGRFVHRFFEIYYRALVVGASGAALGYALWGRAAFALGAAAIAGLALLLRRRILPAMQRLTQQIQGQGGLTPESALAVRSFRRVHALALLVNLLQLALLVWAVLGLRL